VRSLVAETAVIQDKFEEGSEPAKVGITADEQRLRMCLYPHDVDEVLKIRPMQHGRDDMVA
jgi:hypothetical protein